MTTSVPDERLRLMFAPCHPALGPAAQVALTLRLLGGLSTAEVARAFLVPEPTMAQRLARAKAKIRAAHIPFRVPGDDALPERLAAVLDVVCLIFNEGYAASGGDAHVRESLCAEAVRLADVVAEPMPAEPEALGLHALLLAPGRARRRPTRGRPTSPATTPSARSCSAGSARSAAEASPAAPTSGSAHS